MMLILIVLSPFAVICVVLASARHSAEKDVHNRALLLTKRHEDALDIRKNCASATIMPAAGANAVKTDLADWATAML